MRERFKREWLDVKKKSWAKPELRRIDATPEVLQRLAESHPGNVAIDRLIKASTATG